jgi:hypothetical protein
LSWCCLPVGSKQIHHKGTKAQRLTAIPVIPAIPAILVMPTKVGMTGMTGMTSMTEGAAQSLCLRAFVVNLLAFLICVPA